MKDKHILFILVQIDEAHSTEWQIGLENHPSPHKNIQDRLERANNFVMSENVPFPVYVDNWQNEFAEIYQAWPDEYYHFNSDLIILAKSEYGADNNSDALIKLDCFDLIENLLICSYD